MFALLFLLITLMVQTGVSGNQCSEIWFEYGKQCVRYVSRPKKQPDAQAECKKMGANLVSVHSTEDHKRLKVLIKSLTNAFGETWLGGVDLTKNNKWTWLDGSLFDYSAWCVGEPNNIRIQNCIQMNFSVWKCWDNLGCSNTLPYICAK